MDELTIGDKTYISSKRAAEITGYAKDYVGQLCREGRVEATLVGRSWYVLESSIRAHRFGAAVEEQPTAPAKPVSDWQAPVYKPETSEVIPPLSTPVARRSINILDTGAPPVPEEVTKPAPETIADMQTAWKEWFTARSENLVESPEVIDAREDQVANENEKVDTDFVEFEAVPVEPVTHDPIPETPEIEEEIAITRSYVRPAEPMRPQVREAGRTIIRPAKARRKKRSSYLALKALMFSVALLSLAIALVGSGLIDSQIRNSGIGYDIVRFLGGASLISK